ncbi:MAG: acyl-ACP--UDP-N-acetylglucosamine O-acyltransferase [Bacteriovoracaceae bacterium]|nr:acyl-ACP--UDP-N-acetylglucosamine O-acyltransferase [Bacteriovoracaceae bacterium]
MKKEIEIHPSSIVDPKAKLQAGVKIGPFCIVGPDVELGEDTVLQSHVVLSGHVKIGKNNEFYSFCSIGAAPQDLSYKAEATRVEIGDHNIFREYVSVHRGTLKQVGLTKIGNHCLLMAYVHLGHDVVLEDKVVLVNSVNCAGHVHIGSRVTIGGNTGISQWVTLGKGAYIGGGSGIDRDIPPFCTAYGNRIRLKGINIIGLRRQGYTKADISEIVEFYRQMEASTLSPRAFISHHESIQEYLDNPVVKEMIDFINKSEIGIAPFV